MWKSCVWMFCLTVIVLLGSPASAQVFLPSLPEVHAINASAQVGMILSSSSNVPKTSVDGWGLWGWGVETEFELPVNGDLGWATLALGYNQLNLSAQIYQGRQLRGTLRDLPALSLYLGRTDPGWYGGITIAESELINGRLIRAPDPGASDPGPIKVTGGSFSAGVALGYQSKWLFVELGYVGRYFPSLAYDGIPTSGGSPVFPGDLGQRMYAGGFVLRVGATLGVRKAAPPKHTITCADAKTEIAPPAERDFKATCVDDVLTVDVRKKPPATPPPATPPPATPPPATPPHE